MRPMTPHHCRYCGKILRTWHERDGHILDRAGHGGKCQPDPVARLTPEEVRRLEPLKHTFDMKKTRERLGLADATD